RHARFAGSFQRENAHSLMLVRLWHRNPDAYTLRVRRNVLHHEVVRETKTAGWRAECFAGRWGLGHNQADREKEQERKDNSQSHGYLPQSATHQILPMAKPSPYRPAR